MEGKFNSKVALVTGATSGIGKAAAIQFARAGARLVLAARREDLGTALARQIEAEGGQALFVQTDVTDPAAVAHMVEATLQRFGRLDCALNNAGIGGEVMKPTAEHTLENWNAVIATNLTSVWLSMKHEIPALLAAGGGAIVNTASTYGLIGSTAGHAPYAAAKHGVIGLTKSAAIEYAKAGLRVNALCPGWTHSEMVDPALEAMPDMMNAMIAQDVPMARVADAAEIARAALWLCSEEASYVTGTALVADGGWVAR
ncbi:MAG: SDR family oxidoreductase [Betaproteobacteria bacterium]|nr:SDR family oxidoreductase [Betaproteobacteria bacterium]